MKKLAILIIMILAVSLVAADVDFSGTWKVNKDKTEMPEMGAGRDGGGRNAGGRGDRRPRGMDGGNLTVAQNGNDLKIVRTNKDRNGKERTTTIELVIGGEQVVTKSQRGETYTIASWQGDQLKIEEKRYFETPNGDMEMYSKNVWSLLEDGKELLVETTMNTPRGDREMKIYYEK